MRFFAEIPGMLAFRTHALRVQAGRRSVFEGVIWYSIGFLAYAQVRNFVYADLTEIAYRRFSLIGSLLDLNLIQSLIFLLVVYVPALIVLGNFFSGHGLGFSIAREEYQAHVSVLLPLWGALFLIAAPAQWIESSFFVFWILEVSFGMLVRSILLFVYTLWAIKRLSYLSRAQALGVFALSLFALPILQIFSSFLSALPFFIMIPVFYLAFLWLRGHSARRANERSFRKSLQALALNPHDADAQYQLGLIHFKRRNFDSAREYFENALKIQPADPDYHYCLGRACELNGEWQLALEQYEETYRLSPGYGLGDISREVGKAYLHTGSVEKSREFFEFFLKTRSFDPEGRYWLAVALQKLGNSDQMLFQLNTILEQARSNPRFFGKENREWIYRARKLLRDAKSGSGD